MLFQWFGRNCNKLRVMFQEMFMTQGSFASRTYTAVGFLAALQFELPFSSSELIRVVFLHAFIWSSSGHWVWCLLGALALHPKGLFHSIAYTLTRLVALPSYGFGGGIFSETRGLSAKCWMTLRQAVRVRKCLSGWKVACEHGLRQTVHNTSRKWNPVGSNCSSFWG